MPDCMAKTALAKTIDSLVIPPQSEYDFPVKINKFQESKTFICEPPKYLVKNEVAGGKCLGTLSGGKGLYRLMKPTLLPVFIKPNLTFAVVKEIINKNIQRARGTHPHAETDQTDTQYHTSHAHSTNSTTDQYDNMTYFFFLRFTTLILDKVQSHGPMNSILQLPRKLASTLISQI